MNRLSITASELGYVQNISSSTWIKNIAYQGQEKGQQGARVGAMVFPELRSVDWSIQTISEITLTLIYSDDGTQMNKEIHIYSGTKNGLTGTGVDIMGSNIANLSTGGVAYESSHIMVMNNSENSAWFTYFKSFLQNGTTNTLVIYYNETSTQSDDSTNFLGVTGAILNISYEGGSTAFVSPTSLKSGNDITLIITNVISGSGISNVTHKIQWNVGDNYSEVYNLDVGTTQSTFTIPRDWAYKMISLTTKGRCIISTYNDGDLYATQEKEFTLELPDAYAPQYTFVRQSDNPSEDYSTIYYAYINKAIFTVRNIHWNYGPTVEVAEISVSLKDPNGNEIFYDSVQNSTASSTSFTTPILEVSGQYSVTYTVTDSRGATTSVTRNITVNSLPRPTFINNYALADAFSVTRRASPYSSYVAVSYNFRYPKTAGLDSVTHCQIVYGPDNASESQKTKIDVSYTGTYEQGIYYTASQDGATNIITASIPSGTTYSFEMRIWNEAGGSTRRVLLSPTWAPFHLSGTGYGVAFGKYSEASSSSPKVESAWPIYANGGIYGGFNYSSNEEVVGKWINGGSIKRLVYTGIINSADSANYLTSLSSSPTTILRLDGVVKRINTTTYQSTFQALPISNYLYLAVNGSTLNLMINNGAYENVDLYITVIVEYVASGIA